VSGLELQNWLSQSNSPLPVIFLSGRGDVSASVKAMKQGAVDFLTKPVDETALLQTVQGALRRDAELRDARAEHAVSVARLHSLTPREREVMAGVVAGKLNKQIAAELGTVEKTVKVHRARVMDKMGVNSVAELVRVAERLGLSAWPRLKPGGADSRLLA
jgi:FixJ family two-component response regulator